MRFMVVVSVVLGMACASPVLPRNPALVAAETQAFLQHKAAADAAFVKEYNRLALLAADAPDIHIITDDTQHPDTQATQYRAAVPVVVQTQDIHVTDNLPEVVNTHTRDAMGTIHTKWQGALADTVPAGVSGLPRQVTETPEVQAARKSLLAAHAAAPQPDLQYNSNPADNVQPIQNVQKSSVNSVQQAFNFQTNNQPEVVSHNQVGLLVGHLAGHLAGHHTQVAPKQTLSAQETTFRKWEGPFADTVPAGVNGHPQQVTETPEVQAARQALYAAHAAVPQPESNFN